jgi:hypothetical protein
MMSYGAAVARGVVSQHTARREESEGRTAPRVRLGDDVAEEEHRVRRRAHDARERVRLQLAVLWRLLCVPGVRLRPVPCGGVGRTNLGRCARR